MNSEGYAAPPSGPIQRLPSIDPSSYTTHEAAPNISSLNRPGNSEHELQSSVPPDQLSGQMPSRSDVRRALNSTNLLSGGITDPSTGYTGQSPGFTDIMGDHRSAANVVASDVSSEARQPTISDVAAQRDPSYNEMSIVEKKFKSVNPEAYNYMDDDDDY